VPATARYATPHAYKPLTTTSRVCIPNHMAEGGSKNRWTSTSTNGCGLLGCILCDTVYTYPNGGNGGGGGYGYGPNWNYYGSRGLLQQRTTPAAGAAAAGAATAAGRYRYGYGGGGSYYSGGGSSWGKGTPQLVCLQCDEPAFVLTEDGKCECAPGFGYVPSWMYVWLDGFLNQQQRRGSGSGSGGGNGGSTGGGSNRVAAPTPTPAPTPAPAPAPIRNPSTSGSVPNRGSRSTVGTFSRIPGRRLAQGAGDLAAAAVTPGDAAAAMPNPTPAAAPAAAKGTPEAAAAGVAKVEAAGQRRRGGYAYNPPKRGGGGYYYGGGGGGGSGTWKSEWWGVTGD
jgi:hypothetical protein